MIRDSFDVLLNLLGQSPVTLTERELLEPSHWRHGEDAHLREDVRFRETPWGLWMRSEDVVANEAVYRWLHAEKRSQVALEQALKSATELFGRRTVFCPEDPRFVLRQDEIHLSADELSNQPVIEDSVGDFEKYQTHLPLHSLKAAAASEPAGQWGKRAQDQVVEPLGWVRVSLPGHRLNDRMFVAAIEGHSMDDGKSGLVDGGHAIFEFWPSGTKQNLNVLVRGEFSDPETGSFAVKKYVADQRDREGRHNQISLVSLNPDKERFPDIELHPEDDADITVVAKVVQALSLDEFERRPKTKGRAGRRDLKGDGLVKTLDRRLASFFDDAGTDADDEESSSARTSGWQTRLLCLEVTEGGLLLEIGPLEGLPSFVKKLRALGTHWDAVVLAANARTRAIRVPVRPGTGPWRWEAIGFEEEDELGFERLSHEVLDVSVPTIFRVDADGMGQCIKTTTLSLGQAYRILLPPGIGKELGTEIDTGWRIWSIDLAHGLSDSSRKLLASIGLEIGESWPRLEWALASASSWKTNPHGESYPVFETGTELYLNVRGLLVEEGDEAALFLHGASGTQKMPLTSDGIVSLGIPSAGRWVCSILHSRTSVQSTTLLFEVAENTIEFIPASCSVLAPDGVLSLEVTAPAGWPVTLGWRVLAAQEQTLATLWGNENGSIPLDEATSIIMDRTRHTRLADLVVDFRELGLHEVPFDSRISLEEVRETFKSLWAQCSGLVKSRRGAWLQLRTPWLVPVTKLFGYGLEDLSELNDQDVPANLIALGLTRDERSPNGITRFYSRILVLTTEIDTVMRDHRDWVDKSCEKASVREAFITDGQHWTKHRKGSKLRHHVWDLDQVIEHDHIDQMLADFAEGL